MIPRLHKLLAHLCETLDAKRQADTESLYRRALNWEMVARPPLVVTFPLSRDAPFQLYPHREIFAYAHH